MIKNLKVLCTNKQITFLFLLLFSSLLMAVLEFLSLGSIPIFATALIGGNVPGEFKFFENIVNNNHLNLEAERTRKYVKKPIPELA